MNRMCIILFFLPWYLPLNGAKNYVGEALFVHNLSLCVPISNSVLQQLNKLVTPYKPIKLVTDPNVKQLTLFKKYPALKDKIAYTACCNLPSPVQKLTTVADHLRWNSLNIKRDDLLGLTLNDGRKLFGGTKLRKLSFLLGQALAHGAKSVLTFGSAGSNLAVGAAACCQHVGLKSFSLIKPQPNSQIVRRNLLLMDYYGSNIQHCPNIEVRGMGGVYTFFRQKEDFGDFPYVIPPGGSCPIGVIGIINAMLELQEQIKQGQLKEPDRLYVAASTLGTIAGLLIGKKIAQMKTNVIGICVMPEMKPDGAKKLIMQLIDETVTYLHSLDGKIPMIKVTENEIQILYDFRGTQYGLFTQEAVNTIKMLKEKENIVLDGTYTGKAFAGMIEDVKQHKYQNQNILFWNTFYGDDCAQEVKYFSYKKLPKALQSYFETDVQELDKTV